MSITPPHIQTRKIDIASETGCKCRPVFPRVMRMNDYRKVRQATLGEHDYLSGGHAHSCVYCADIIGFAALSIYYEYPSPRTRSRFRLPEDAASFCAFAFNACAVQWPWRAHARAYAAGLAQIERVTLRN